MHLRKSLVALVAAAAIAAGVMAPATASAAKKGKITAKANGRFKANLVRQAGYTAANKQLVINGTQRKGRGMNILTVMCLGTDITPGFTGTITQCIGTFTSVKLATTQTWVTGDGGSMSVTVTAYDGTTISATFEGNAPGNSSTGGTPLQILNGRVKKLPISVN